MREGFKEYNLKKVFTLVFGNCADRVKTMLKVEKHCLAKSKDFDHLWIINKVKVIVLGLETEVNKRVTMYSTRMSFMLTNQCDNETSASCLAHFKSVVQNLTTTGGTCVLASKTMLSKDLNDATDDEIENEKEKFLTMCFVLRSSELMYKKLLGNLKQSTKLRRDENPHSLNNAFDLLVWESREHDGERCAFNRRNLGDHGDRGSRGRN